MNSIINTLTPETKETLLSWCEDHSYIEVKQLAAKPLSEGGLNLKISKSTLCRFYTTHGIADSKEARAQYAASLGLAEGKTLLDAAHENLEHRLFELSARPNMATADLRLVSQITTRLRSLQLGQQRLQLAQAREERIAEAAKPAKIPTPEEADEAIHILLGKNFARDERWNSSRCEESGPAEGPVPAPSNHPTQTPEPRWNPSRCEESSPVEEPAPETSTPPTTTPPPPIIQISESEIQKLALDHAERCYPSHRRPKCPIFGRNFDREKQHCIDNRIQIERERAKPRPEQHEHSPIASAEKSDD